MKANPQRTSKHTAWHLQILLVAGLVLLYCSSPVRASGNPPLQGAWRAVQHGDTPARILAEASQGQLIPFDTRKLHTFPHQDLGSWVVLQPRAQHLPQPRVLSISSPPFGRVTLYSPHGPVTWSALNGISPATPGYGRLAFALPHDWKTNAPILVKFEPSTSISAPVKFHLQSHARFERINTLWLSMASASLAVMLAMALVALCFSVMLRDTTFAWYAAYVSCYACVQAIQTGFVFHPLQWYALAPMALPIGSMLTALSVIFAVLFMVRFCNLRKHAPWLNMLLLALAGSMAFLATLTLTGLPLIREVVQTLFNPLLAVCSALMVLGSSVALLRGSRSALFFLFGWLPLLVITALASAQVGGALPRVDWLHSASLAVGALEALVLAIGLADRSLTMRKDHVRARELADKDPLTGVLNRRAWIEAAQQRLLDPERSQTLLFMDLDHFKTLNDELGHGAGDKALIAMAETFGTELRPQDLLGRFGGEEFVALLSDTGGENARLVAQRLCRRMHRMEIAMNREGALLTVSIGLAHRHANDTLSSLVERADAAMYAAKSQGRNRVVEEDGAGPRSRHVLRPSRNLSDLGSTPRPDMR